MSHKRAETGFGHMLLLGAVVVIAVLAFVTYRVATNQVNDSTSGTSQKSSAVAVPDAIKTNDDLSKTQAAVKDAPIENDLNPADLNEDVDSLL